MECAGASLCHRHAPQGINDGGIARSYLLDLVESYEQRRGCWGDDEAGPISPCQLRYILNALDGLIEQEPVMVVSPQSVWRPTCRSEERRVGKGWGGTCNSRWGPCP